MRIGYLYSGKEEYIEKLLKYDLTIIVTKSTDIKKVEKFNTNVIRLDCIKGTFDIVIYDNEYVPYIKAKKRIIIGNKTVPRCETIPDFDIEKILAKPQKTDIEFSIVMPNYNNGEWIHGAIQSIVEQTYPYWKLYIIAFIM